MYDKSQYEERQIFEINKICLGMKLYCFTFYLWQF